MKGCVMQSSLFIDDDADSRLRDRTGAFRICWRQGCANKTRRLFALCDTHLIEELTSFAALSPGQANLPVLDLINEIVNHPTPRGGLLSGSSR